MPVSTAGWELFAIGCLFCCWVFGMFVLWTWRRSRIRQQLRTARAMTRMTAARVRAIRQMDATEDRWRP